MHITVIILISTIKSPFRGKSSASWRRTGGLKSQNNAKEVGLRQLAEAGGHCTRNEVPSGPACRGGREAARGLQHP
jgi:hypothetical protein